MTVALNGPLAGTCGHCTGGERGGLLPPGSQQLSRSWLCVPFLRGDTIDVHALGAGEGLRLGLQAVGGRTAQRADSFTALAAVGHSCRKHTRISPGLWPRPQQTRAACIGTPGCHRISIGNQGWKKSEITGTVVSIVNRQLSNCFQQLKLNPCRFFHQFKLWSLNTNQLLKQPTPTPAPLPRQTQPSPSQLVACMVL